MTQQPFTPNGVQAMMAELAQLSPQDLQTQVGLIRSDLRSWVSNNFTLDSSQLSYLNAMDQRFFDYASGVTAFAVANSLSVTLTKPTQPKPTKLVHVSDDIDVLYSPSGTTTITGGVSYEIEYQ